MLIIMSSAYELYAAKSSDDRMVTKVGLSQSDSASQMTSMADRFKSTFSHKDVKVHFVGAWYDIEARPSVTVTS
jgi:uncharacterized protein (DUF2235 family)